ncbi:thermonuclease family protein [Gallibacterium salpingitidis]|uniref:thermonuclease family protein n=1 Tax=Gallibacterium salpingitidis TaxID=505341 RepID=UPI00266FFF12|nr:thermonuclease family protein [Gallibacterium salpingitidis]WKT00564.1 thermonuclease family protein [Gallibacterium salpingitidis]
MKRIIIAFLFTLVAINSFAAREIQCRVVSISDGDTFTCLLKNNKQIRVRLAQVDAPEKKQPYGDRSRQLLSQLIFKKNITIQSDEYDRYGRVVGQVFDASGKNINLTMVQQGLAWAYREYLHSNQYLQAETEARQKRLGLWQDENPIYPSNWRKHEKNPSAPLAQNPTAPLLALPKPGKTSVTSNNCGTRRSCKSFSSCAEATQFFKQCSADYLDGNHDGIPCNSLCR